MAKASSDEADLAGEVDDKDCVLFSSGTSVVVRLVILLMTGESL